MYIRPKGRSLDPRPPAPVEPARNRLRCPDADDDPIIEPRVSTDSDDDFEVEVEVEVEFEFEVEERDGRACYRLILEPEA